MAQNFIPCARDQVMLLPPDLQEWLPADHLARFVIATVDQLDLSGIYGFYRQDGLGRPAHDPAMMTALLLFNYAVGVRSSRQIERRCVEDVACRVITGNRQPDHATIARFRARHQDALSGLFLQVLALCQRAGMVSVGTVAVDSTKLAANASPARNRTYDALREQARAIIEQAGEIDAREDELFGDRRGDELPEDLADPTSRAARIRELLDELEAERERAGELQRKREEGEPVRGKRPKQPGKPQRLLGLENRKFNLTDPDSAIVRHRGMLMQGYTVQTVAGEGQLILAASPVGLSPDQGQLGPAVARARENLDQIGVQEPIGEVLADSGYWTLNEVRALREAGQELLIPPKITARARERADPEAQAMFAKLESAEGKRRYLRRQQIIEPVFAHIKHQRGITRLLRRGQRAVQAEIDLIATTHNLLKLRTALIAG